MFITFSKCKLFKMYHIFRYILCISVILELRLLLIVSSTDKSVQLLDLKTIEKFMRISLAKITLILKLICKGFEYI